MRATTFAIVFPDGDFEVDATSEGSLPAIGDLIERKRLLWTVTRISDGDPAVVYVGPLASPEATS